MSPTGTIADLTPPDRTTDRQQVVRGRVIYAPNDTADKMSVVLVNYSNTHEYTIESGNWVVPGLPLPQVGDVVLVAFDDNGDAWVLGWTHSVEEYEALRQIHGLLTRRHTDSRGDDLPFGVRRAYQIRRPLDSVRYTGPGIPDGFEEWSDQQIVPEDDTGPERVNATAGGLALSFHARLVAHPCGLGSIEDVYEWAEALLPLQWADPNKLNYGGFMASPNSNTASAFGTAEAAIGFLDAWRVTGETKYRDAAIRAAYFCLRLSDPNTYWFPKYGVNPINRVANGYTWAGFCDEVTAADKITTTCTMWNLKASLLLEEVYKINGDTDLHDAAMAAAEFMLQGAVGVYDYFAVSSNLDATYVTATWPNLGGHSFNDGEFRRAGDSVGTGTVGTDQLEYSIPVLAALGFVNEMLELYPRLRDLPSYDVLSPFGVLFVAAMCWSGFFRYGPDAAFNQHFGSYYDTQGAGTLAGFKALFFPGDYRASLAILLHVATKGGSLDGNLDTIASDMLTYRFATQGIIVLAGAGLGMLNALEGKIV